MKASPLFLGACAFASIAGAVGGATTNTTPIQNAGIGMDMIPDRPIAFDPSHSGLPDIAPPDHYPIVTPQGRIEVAELSTRGLYAQQRFGWRSANYDAVPEPALVDEPAYDHWAQADTSPPAIVTAPMDAPVEPLDLKAVQGRTEQHRVIDVAASLDGQG
jgi:hypothetical protein